MMTAELQACFTFNGSICSDCLQVMFSGDFNCQSAARVFIHCYIVLMSDCNGLCNAHSAVYALQ